MGRFPTGRCWSWLAMPRLLCHMLFYIWGGCVFWFSCAAAWTWPSFKTSCWIGPWLGQVRGLPAYLSLSSGLSLMWTTESGQPHLMTCSHRTTGGSWLHNGVISASFFGKRRPSTCSATACVLIWLRQRRSMMISCGNVAGIKPAMKRRFVHCLMVKTCLFALIVSAVSRMWQLLVFTCRKCMVKGLLPDGWLRVLYVPVVVVTTTPDPDSSFTFNMVRWVVWSVRWGGRPCFRRKGPWNWTGSTLLRVLHIINMVFAHRRLLEHTLLLM